MPRRPTSRKPKRGARKTRPRRTRGLDLSRLVPSTGSPKLLRAFRRARAAVQIIACATIVFAVWLALNWTFQAARKPSELFFPVSDRLYKTPSQTWRTYAPLFRRHSTRVMAPELLAAIAQAEGSGNPLARTYWRWSWTLDPFSIYRPASSAVGMYQITDGTFAEARRYCIHDHRVATEGPWHALGSCWFNSLYTRTVPSHAVELTSAYLDRRVAQVLEHAQIADATLEQKQNLAAVIHLCGAGGGARYARQGLEADGQQCGAHDLETYLAKVNRMKRVFAGLAAGSGGG